MSDLDISTNTVQLHYPKDKKRRSKTASWNGNKKKKLALAPGQADFATFEEVPWVLKVDDTGFWFTYGSAENIHAAMEFPNLPVGLIRGANAADSKANLRTWIQGQFAAVSPDCLVQLPNGLYSCAAFHQLSFAQWNACLLRINDMLWGAFCIVNNRSCGSLWAANRIGPVTLTPSLMKQGPFVSEDNSQ